MADTFAITTPTPTIPLNAKRQGSAVFTVSNQSGRPIRGRGRIVAANPAAAPWLTLEDPTERDFPLAGTQQYSITLAVPPTATQGDYTFRLDVVGVDNPDEELSSGPTVSFTVPAPEKPPQPFPWWIVAVAGGVLLLIIVGVVIFLVVQDNNQKAAAAAAHFDGEWDIAAGHLSLTHDLGNVRGPFTDSLASKVGTVQGNVSGSTWTGQATVPTVPNASFSMVISQSDTLLLGTHPFCGSRAGTPFPVGCSFAGDWTLSLTGLQCPMNAQVVNQQVIMTLSGACVVNSPRGPRPIVGTAVAGLSFPGAGQIRAAGGIANGLVSLTFLQTLTADATQFQGNYNGVVIDPVFGSFPISGSWCGARAGHPLPC